MLRANLTVLTIRFLTELGYIASNYLQVVDGAVVFVARYIRLLQ